MSSSDENVPLEILRSPPATLHPAVIALYLEAFYPKLGPIFGDRQRTEAFLTPAFQPDHAMVAMRGEQVLGVAGFRQGGKGMFHRPVRDFFIEYRWSAPLRLILLAMVERAEEPDILVMDGIAVSAVARGHGVGTALLGAIAEHARSQGKKGVRLDVVDTNPRARKLYEREGFTAQKTIGTWPLSHLFPFRAIARMLKPV